MHGTALLKKHFRKLAQELALLQIKLRHEVATRNLLQRLIERVGLLSIREHAPEGAERTAGFALGDEIHSGKDRGKHGTPTPGIVQDLLPKIPIQPLKLIAHTTKIRG